MNRPNDTDAALAVDLDDAEYKAIDALACCKFASFGYWAGVWVHLNRISGRKRRSPFKLLVQVARKMRTQY